MEEEMKQIYKSQLSVGGEFGDGIDVLFVTPMPSRWVRFWYWVLLQWKWRPVNSEEIL